MLVAPAFHERILPSRVLLIIASSDEETMAASRVDSSSRSRLAVRSITASANCKLLGPSVIGVAVIWTVPHSLRKDGRYLHDFAPIGRRRERSSDACDTGS